MIKKYTLNITLTKKFFVDDEYNFSFGGEFCKELNDLQRKLLLLKIKECIEQALKEAD